MMLDSSMGYEFVKPPGGMGLKEVRFGNDGICGVEGREDHWMDDDT